VTDIIWVPHLREYTNRVHRTGSSTSHPFEPFALSHPLKDLMIQKTAFPQVNDDPLLREQTPILGLSGCVYTQPSGGGTVGIV